ncbi:MAG TPA: cyclase family protein [Candidatus Latescibacteria bacterium]|nr:cyclase family protein [Candidatus Latescibacterota bacterium]MDP7634172.1 cyclase family protein [Candidatus Latescibacterota bacterium]HJN29946.1 cyclase family protein [Candidatus Latescibacterota bacterium]
MASEPSYGNSHRCPKAFLRRRRHDRQAPLDTLVGSCCVVDHQDKILDGDAIDPYRGVQRLLLRSNHSGAAEDGVYPPHGPLLTAEAAAILVESGLLLVGTDRLSVDGSDSTDYTLHRLFLSASCFIMEGLDLGGVTPGDHELIALPLKVVGAEASPARVLVS